jgi:hypothetical protein
LEAGQSLDAGTTIGRLNVIVSEFMVSLYGNGIDAYNAYRRTGAPTTMQPNLELNQEVSLDLSYTCIRSKY